MSEGIEEVINTPKNVTFRMTNGNDVLTLSIFMDKEKYLSYEPNNGAESQKREMNNDELIKNEIVKIRNNYESILDNQDKILMYKETDCMRMRLLSNDTILCDISEKGYSDAFLEQYPDDEGHGIVSHRIDAKKCDMGYNIAKKILFNQGSKEKDIIKKFLDKIVNNPLVDDIKKNISIIEHKQKEDLTRKLNNSKLAKLRNKVAKVADKIAEATGTEKIVQKFTDGKKITDVEISAEKKAWEKKFSDKIFGEVKE